MLGIIIAGHSHFPQGVISAVNLLVGEQEDFEGVSYVKEDTPEVLRHKFIQSIEKLSNCDSIVVLCDLYGGSPYRCALELSLNKYDNLHILSGINMPMVAEAIINRDFINDGHEFAEKLLNKGKDSIRISI